MRERKEDDWYGFFSLKILFQSMNKEKRLERCEGTRSFRYRRGEKNDRSSLNKDLSWKGDQNEKILFEFHIMKGILLIALPGCILPFRSEKKNRMRERIGTEGQPDGRLLLAPGRTPGPFLRVRKRDYGRWGRSKPMNTDPDHTKFRFICLPSSDSYLSAY